MMKNKQQGIALIMVLVFLLLMTLISATAIQQNSLQFAMIGNMQEQSQTFTHAENILKAVERAIELNRWTPARIANNTLTSCNRDGAGNHALITPGTAFNLGVSGNTAVVQSVWCQNNPDTALAPVDQNGDGAINAADVGYGQPDTCDIDDTVAGGGAGCANIPVNGFAPFPFNQGFDFPAMGCGTELYTIRVTYAQQNESGAERIVESRFAVQCLN